MSNKTHFEIVPHKADAAIADEIKDVFEVTLSYSTHRLH